MSHFTNFLPPFSLSFSFFAILFLCTHTHTNQSDIKHEFKLAPKDKLASVGDTVTLDCLPEAWPEPSIKWRHNGQLIELNDVSSSSSVSSSVSTGEGSELLQSKYTVNRIARTTSDQSQQQQQQQVNDNSQLIDVFGSQLVIRQVDKSDQGKYSCLVETKGSHRLIERESNAAKLTVLGK